MSTNIGWAFVVGTTDASELSRLVRSFSERLAPIRLEQHARLLAERTAWSIDRSVALGREWTPRPLSSAFREIDDAGRESDAKGTRAVFEDFGMSVSLIPDAATASTYGILHAERGDWKRRWMLMEGIRPFDYQNSTDRPSGIRAAEWELRRDTWDRIMPSGIPARHGFSAMIAETRVVSPRLDVLRFQPTLSRRKVAIAKEIHMSRLIEGDGGIGSDGAIRSVMRAASTLSTPQGKESVQAIASELRLPRRITRALAMQATRPDDADLDLA